MASTQRAISGPVERESSTAMRFSGARSSANSRAILRAVHAAGQARGNGDGDAPIRLFEFFQPGLRRGAGGVARHFAPLHRIQHGGHMQCGIVHKILVARADDERHAGNGAGGRFQHPIAAGIRHDFPLHCAIPPSAPVNSSGTSPPRRKAIVSAMVSRMSRGR